MRTTNEIIKNSLVNKSYKGSTEESKAYSLALIAELLLDIRDIMNDKKST